MSLAETYRLLTCTLNAVLTSVVGQIGWQFTKPVLFYLVILLSFFSYFEMPLHVHHFLFEDFDIDCLVEMIILSCGSMHYTVLFHMHHNTDYVNLF